MTTLAAPDPEELGTDQAFNAIRSPGAAACEIRPYEDDTGP